MGYGVVPETLEEFERQFGRERIATAAAECGIRTTSPQNRLTDDQRRVLFQRLVGVSVESTTGSRQSPKDEAQSASGIKTTAPAAAPTANVPVRSEVANPSTIPSASEASVDSNRLLRQIHEERVARANVEQALREQRSRADALGNQIEQRDNELERMADAERQLRHEITSLSARLQSLQRIADENKELRSELRSQAAVIAASSRHQVAEARADLLRAEIKALRREAEKAEKLHFEGIRQRTQIAALKEKIDTLKMQLRAASSRGSKTKSDGSLRPTATKLRSQLEIANRRIVSLEKKLREIASAGDVNASAAIDFLLDTRVQAWTRKQGSSRRKLVLPRFITVSGHTPLSAGALEALLVSHGIDIAPVGDPRAETLIVGRDGWLIDEIEDQIKVRAGKELFIYSQEMLLTALLVGADPFRPCDRKVLLAFADGHDALQYCRTEGFNWPQIDTTSIARALAYPWDDRVGESPLKKLGYTVGVSKGLTQDKRREILEEAFESKLPNVDSKSYMATWGKPGTRHRLRRIARFLAWLKRNAEKRDANMRQAIAEWSSDLNWLFGFYQPWMRFRWPSTHVDGPSTPVGRRSGTKVPSTPRAVRRTATSTPNYRRVLRVK